MKYLKRFNESISVENISMDFSKVSKDVEDICFDLSELVNIKIWSDNIKSIKIKDEPDLNNQSVLIIDIEPIRDDSLFKSIKLNPDLFETLAWINHYCVLNSFNIRFADMYLPFEKYEDFILQLQGIAFTSNYGGSIVIIIYQKFNI